MSTTPPGTTPSTTPAAAAPPPPAAADDSLAVAPGAFRRVVGYSWWATFGWVGWVWLAAVLVWVGIVVLTLRYGELGDSIWVGAGMSWTRWIIGAAAVVLATQGLPMFVANGVTRRDAARGSLVALALLVVAWSAIVTAVALVEGVVFDAADVVRTLHQSERHVFDSMDQWGLVFVESLVAYAGFAVGGWFVGTAYYRFGPYLGTLLLPIGLLAGTAVELLVSGSTLPEEVLDWRDDLRSGIGMALCLLVVAGVLAGARGLQRSMPLRSRPR